MRLVPALALEASVSGFGDPEERQERRAARIRARARRRIARRRAKARKLRAKAREVEARYPARAAKLRARADLLDPPARRGPGPVVPASVPARLEPLSPEGPEPTDFEPEPPDEVDVQGIGLSWPRRRARPVRWSPPAAMGPHIRIQAAEGFRAAVVPLRPGLFLVAEVPEAATRPQFGIAPLLAPLVLHAAKRAIDNPEPRLRRRPLAALLQRRRALPAPAPAAPAAAQAASTALVPAGTEADRAAAALVGRWAGADDLAGLLGDACDREDCR